MRKAHEKFPVSTQFNIFENKLQFSTKNACNTLVFQINCYFQFMINLWNNQLLQFCGDIQCCTAKNHFDLQFGQSTFVDFLFKVGKGTIYQGKDGEYFTFKSAIFLWRFRFSMLFLFCISDMELLSEHKCFLPRKG